MDSVYESNRNTIDIQEVLEQIKAWIFKLNNVKNKKPEIKQYIVLSLV